MASWRRSQTSCVSVVATRNYDGGGDRTISGAFLHLARSLGYRDDQIDIAALSTLEETYWTPRGEYFDHQASSDSTSAKDIFDKIAEAGMGYFLLSDGLLSVGREGVKSWTGIITPQDTVEEMQTSFRVPSEDDFDGVDVKYINPCDLGGGNRTVPDAGKSFSAQNGGIHH